MKALATLLMENGHLLLRGAWVAMTLLAISSRWIGLVDRMADHGKLVRVALPEDVSTFQRRILQVMVRLSGAHHTSGL